MKRIAVLGSTGSIGTSTLEVIADHPEEMQLTAITAHNSWEKLAEQSRQFCPRWSVLSNSELKSDIKPDSFSPSTELLFGDDQIERVASSDEVDIVICGIVGAAGLKGAWAAIEAGKIVGIANKETLVVAGPLIMDLAARTQATLLPVDSEHNAIFQALQAGHPSEVKQVILTASGGPFRGATPSELENVTPEMALAHPTWEMGPKITVDSATMMNKALEIIEAKWLFNLKSDQISVVVHPQSIVHSMVEYVDGSVIAQLSPPDMRLPIQYALTYPDRREGLNTPMDWSRSFELSFEPPDMEAFPALRLGYEVAEKGGTCGAVLNAANETAVERFLSGGLRFCDIATSCKQVLESHQFDPNPSLEELFLLDGWARKEIKKWN
ncbi:MAG: 1-deoxy-D-xylulose-5-phosphate reductoisomerase [Planctomycetes bacterium]|nr:1-deoxy-D-xylulose-5-phosphate reductoisomerase [Planctomycetota bacterium]MCH9727413.1 1-deoxy-D-xylulose-5-phosphate reductoisomerase [Planctomycetota bacterium]MCH9775918.1 1-deoxy-D-xylulose-5-phosphate reductoisomerase [Planctomycetota bacterium]MCH9793190.1 1-deoxy-D-xylulose-5-phosphate reductoisomerase [Planctomycetota bacterium]MDF1743981.1 1-deoxy-D-xylulose-5-phosphate reductoisomerase [Gimesia sp.]